MSEQLHNFNHCDRFILIINMGSWYFTLAVYEQRVKKGSAKGETEFANLVSKRRDPKGKGEVLIEMKSVGRI